MATDELFRWILVATFAAFLPFGLYHRIRSNIGGEKLDRWQEGLFILFGPRLSGLPWFIGGIVWMIDPKLMEWATVPLPVWMRWGGFVLIAVWGVLTVWTFQTLGKNLTDIGNKLKQTITRLMRPIEPRAFFDFLWDASPHASARGAGRLRFPLE